MSERRTLGCEASVVLRIGRRPVLARREVAGVGPPLRPLLGRGAGAGEEQHGDGQGRPDKLASTWTVTSSMCSASDVECLCPHVIPSAHSSYWPPARTVEPDFPCGLSPLQRIWRRGILAGTTRWRPTPDHTRRDRGPPAAPPHHGLRGLERRRGVRHRRRALSRPAVALAAAASIDPEEFYHFGLSRPYVRFKAGSRTEREIIWPSTEFSLAQPDCAGPRHHRGRRHRAPPQVAHLLRRPPRLARRLRRSLVLTLGALLAEVSHTRPVRLVGSAYDSELSARLGLRPTRYEGPTGIVGRAQHACRDQGIPVAALWANVPHYISGIENPKASMALVRRVLSLINAEADLSDLEESTRQFEQNLEEIVSQNAKIAEYVKKLERKKPEEGDEDRRPHRRRATSCRPPATSWPRSSSSCASSAAPTRPDRAPPLPSSSRTIALVSVCAVAPRERATCAPRAARDARRARPSASRPALAAAGRLGAGAPRWRRRGPRGRREPRRPRRSPSSPTATATAAVIGIDLETQRGPRPWRIGVVDADGTARAAAGVAHRPRARSSRCSGSRFRRTRSTSTRRRRGGPRRRQWRSARSTTPSTPERLWRGAFTRSARGGDGEGHGFGARRIINGQPRRPHAGTDYAARARHAGRGEPIAGAWRSSATSSFGGRLVDARPRPRPLHALHAPRSRRRRRGRDGRARRGAGRGGLHRPRHRPASALRGAAQPRARGSR